MDEDELNDDILRLHGYTSEEDSDDGGKTELDDFYYYHKPPPIDIDPNKHNIITTGVTKIPKNQLRRLRKKFANVENNTDKSEVGTTDLQLNEASNLTENHTPQLLSKSQKKRLRRKKKLVNGADCVTQPEEEENPDDGGTKRSIPEDFDFLQDRDNLVQNKPQKRSNVELPLLWLQNSCDLRRFTAVLILVIVLKKVLYFHHFVDLLLFFLFMYLCVFFVITY